jgi:DNA-binding response OmpR family regulator
MISKEGVLERGLHFISKPLSPTDLLQKVREVLDRKEA